MQRLFRSILITGGHGMLGRAVQRELAARGRPFTALGSADCDITRPEAVQAMVDQHRPTLLINCAAWTDVDGCEKDPARADAVNGRAVGSLADAARRHSAKLVHLSTDFVFDGARRVPYRPEDATHPHSVYGRSKLLGERLLRQAEAPGWLIVRTAWLYGPGGRCFPRRIAHAARAGRPLAVVADQTGTPTFTHDLASILVDLVERDAAGVFHATNAGQTTWHGFARAVLDAFAIPAGVAPITSEAWKRMHPGTAHRPAFSALDIGETERVIGRTIRPWEEALAEYARGGEG